MTGLPVDWAGAPVRDVVACRECGSHDVQVLKLCWVDANGDADVRPGDVDHDSDPGSMGYTSDTWCPDCESHPSFDYLRIPVDEPLPIKGGQGRTPRDVTDAADAIRFSLLLGLALVVAWLAS